MSEEDLELLITLDDPEGAPEEDIFHHLAANNTYNMRSSSNTRMLGPYTIE
jgi:hypothetical protein